MKNKTIITQSTATGGTMLEILYSTDDLAKMFRVGKSTIKRWTDEGKLQCFKTPGGHRKFKPSNVHEFIKLYHYEIVTPLLPFARTSETITPDAVMVGPEVMMEECFNGAIKGKRQIIEETFSTLALQGQLLPAMFDQLLTPVIRLIHTKHLQHQITSVEFQIAKNTLIHALIHFTKTLPKMEKKDVGLYCLSVQDGMNEVELKAVELLLDTMGLTVYNLGSVLTKYSANDIVNQCRPEDVFVVQSQEYSSDNAFEQFNILTSGVKAYGGNVYTSHFFDGINSGIIETQFKRFQSYSEIAHQLSIEKQAV